MDGGHGRNVDKNRVEVEVVGWWCLRFLLEKYKYAISDEIEDFVETAICIASFFLHAPACTHQLADTEKVRWSVAIDRKL